MSDTAASATAVTADEPREVRLPKKHAQDWFERLGEEFGAEKVAESERTVTLRLPRKAMKDLISDTTYYVEEMDPENTGDIDYRPAARRCLAALTRLGLVDPQTNKMTW